MRFVAALTFLLLAACAPIPDQKLADGQAGCITVTGVYGSASSVVTRADNPPKGSNSSGKTRITCGSAVLEIDHNVSQPEPRPAPPPSVKP